MDGAVDGVVDHFARLGLARRYDLDRERLEQAYLERAPKVHPDRFVGGTSAQQREAMESSAALNEGYRVLRDPVRRAEYLCKLAGIDVDSSDPRSGAPAMGQDFLIEMIERREAVEQARAQGAAAVDALRDEVEGELDEALDRAVEALARGAGEASGEAPGQLSGAAVTEAARALVQRRYLQRLLDELEGETGR